MPWPNAQCPGPQRLLDEAGEDGQGLAQALAGLLEELQRPLLAGGVRGVDVDHVVSERAQLLEQARSFRVRLVLSRHRSVSGLRGLLVRTRLPFRGRGLSDAGAQRA